MLVFPAIDLLNGCCVRLKTGDFNQVRTYSDDPVMRLRDFIAQGARHVHVVDLNGARSPGDRQKKVLGRLLGGCDLDIQVGGGIRSMHDAVEILELGASRVVVGTLAVRDGAMVAEMIRSLGADRVVVALDVRDLDVAVEGWTRSAGRTLSEVLSPLLEAGLKTVLCTDISRDGMLEGPNLALYATLRREFPDVSIQASGGVACPEDLVALKRIGMQGVIVGRAVYEGRLTLSDALAEGSTDVV